MTKRKAVMAVAVFVGLSATAACGDSDGSSSAANGTSPAGDGARAETSEAPAPDNVETLDGTVLADFDGDAAAGETVFAQCRACHVVEPGVNRTGPTLHNIVGHEAGQIEGFNYTDANANSGITWTPEKLFQYLEDPRRVIPGTRMAYAGLSDPQDRADLIAFLQTHSE